MRGRTGANTAGQVYLTDMQENKVGKNTSLEALRKRGLKPADDDHVGAAIVAVPPPTPAEQESPAPAKRA